MAPPKGNKYAFGHGRPPKPGFSNEELIVLGEDLLKWMKEKEKEEVVHLSEFYSEKKGISPSYWKDNIADRECFRSYYERALVWMGKKLLKNKKLSPTYGSRFIGIYFKEVKEHEFDEKKKIIDYELDQKAARQQTISPFQEDLDKEDIIFKQQAEIYELKQQIINANK